MTHAVASFDDWFLYSRVYHPVFSVWRCVYILSTKAVHTTQALYVTPPKLSKRIYKTLRYLTR